MLRKTILIEWVCDRHQLIKAIFVLHFELKSEADLLFRRFVLPMFYDCKYLYSVALTALSKNLPEKISLIRKSLELDCEKGASCWLSALPFQSLRYVLNKRESSETVSTFAMDGLSPMFLDYVLAASKMT